MRSSIIYILDITELLKKRRQCDSELRCKKIYKKRLNSLKTTEFLSHVQHIHSNRLWFEFSRHAKLLSSYSVS